MTKLVGLDERLIEAEDILWQRAGGDERGMQRGGGDDEHGAGERRRGEAG